MADALLLGRVAELLREDPALGADAAFTALLARFREYARKPQLALRKAVVAALERARGRASMAAVASVAAAAAPPPPPPPPPPHSLNASLYAAAAPPATGAGAAPAEPPAAKAPKRRRREAGDTGVPPSQRPRVAEGGGGSGAPPAEWILPEYVRPSARYADVAGLGGVLRTFRTVVELALAHTELFAHIGVEPPRGVLLHGPPGCGKTLLAHALGGELGVFFRAVSGPELVGSLAGESEARLRALFDDAASNAPAILFIDDIDAIAPRRDGSSRGGGSGGAGGMERRMLSQLLSCIDGLTLERTGGKPVVLLAATNRPDSIDGALRRTGRFDREVSIPIPDERAREDILRTLTKGMRLGGGVCEKGVEPAGAGEMAMAVEARGGGGGGVPEGLAAAVDAALVPPAAPPAFDFCAIARVTPGYVGADLAALAKEAAVCAISRFLDEGDIVIGNSSGDAAASATTIVAVDPAPDAIKAPLPSPLAHLSVSFADFLAATKLVQPSALREGFAAVPTMSWDDVGALAEVRGELEMAIVAPLRRPEAFAALGLSVPAGVLLYGPPGCGKTLLAKAIAAESAANFISVKGPELLDKYVGESERAVRQLFQRARASAPCIIFFDELDALAPRRGGSGGGGGEGSGGGGSVTERVVNQLLTEMDGLEARRDVFVIAATNRPDIIDPAMLRPGRLDKLLYVPLPSPQERAAILRTQARRMPLAPDVDFDALALHPAAARFSGADLAALMREAAVGVLKDFFAEERAAGAGAGGGVGVVLPLPAQRHFLAAFAKVQPSVSLGDERMYSALRNRLRGGRTRLEVGASAPEGGVEAS